MIKSSNLCFTYQAGSPDDYVLKDISAEIAEGEFVAILGRNGSGKSTLARHLNALLTPTSGTLWVMGLDTSKQENIWQVRQTTGMVFQNPDNQIVATLVEDDVAFGPENLGVCPKEIVERVESNLKTVRMEGYKKTAPHNLSGGQKQRVAIAGILAMKPNCIVLDEATAMLDPLGRREVLETARQLNTDENITIIFITHFMEEALLADRLIVMESGRIELDASPKQIFADPGKIKSLGLNLPSITALCNRLSAYGVAGTIIGDDEFMEDDVIKNVLTQSIGSVDVLTIPGKISVKHNPHTNDCPGSIEEESKPLKAVIKVTNLSHSYSVGSVFEKKALCDINMEIHPGEIAAIIGHTGSGKSTLVQHFNALLFPTGGTVEVEGEDIHADKAKLKTYRQKVGVVFQYPEYQLFESTVLKDVCFGPKQMQMEPSEAEECAKEALDAVGIPKSFYGKSPFELSGGQKRRVAIAGVLAMRPSILVLDEPTAGLDPCGKDEILSYVMELHKRKKITVVFVSHSMDDVALLASKIFVMNNGRLHLHGTPREVFAEEASLNEIGLDVPKINKLFIKLNKINPNIPKNVLTVDEAENVFKKLLEVKIWQK